MGRKHRVTGEESLRLDAIGKHLGVQARYPDPSFRTEVRDAALERVRPIIDRLRSPSGEEIAGALAKELSVTFEEVHGPRDVTLLEDKYFRGKREIGFAQLRAELLVPGVDALLFQRLHAAADDPDRWVAVLNLQGSRARGYWDRHHELTHRIAEPPQKILPFRRHIFEATNPVESLIDFVTADIAFYAPAVCPRIAVLASNPLTFSVVERFRLSYAPTASILSTMKAVVRHWPKPAAALTAEFRGRFGQPDADKALRVTVQGYSETAADAGLSFFSNMRPPQGSPIYRSYHSGTESDAEESLGLWTTSSGDRLADIFVLTSARMFRGKVYALVSCP